MVTLAAGGCSSDEPAAKRGAPSATPSAGAPHEVATKARFGAVTGKLPRQRRERLKPAVEQVVDRWIDAAYVGGDYPRASFPKTSWPGFTSDARARAAHDRRLTSNAAIGADIDGVDVTRRNVTLDVLAARHRPVGVTARVLLVFRTTGSKELVVRVAGRLFLSHYSKGWRVFGYDLARDARKRKGGAA